MTYSAKEWLISIHVLLLIINMIWITTPNSTTDDWGSNKIIAGMFHREFYTLVYTYIMIAITHH